MSAFNYWIGLGYSPDVALKLSKSKNQGKLIQAHNDYASTQEAAKQRKNPTPAPPPAPEPIKIKDKFNTTPRRLIDGEDGSNLKIKRKSKRKRKAQALGTGQLRINPSSTVNTGGAGAAASSGGVNI